MPKKKKDAQKAAKDLKGKKKIGKGHLVVLLDESGSMGHLQEAVVSGCNEFIHTFRKEDVKVTVGFFDKVAGEDLVRFPIKAQKIKSVKQLVNADYNPRGSTPLNDAISKTIEIVEKEVKKDETVFFAIITDGLENASELSSEDITKIVQKYEDKKGWGFVYLGANQNAEQAAANIGLAKHGHAHNIVASAGGMAATMDMAGSLGTSRMAAGPGAQGNQAYMAVAGEEYDKTGGKVGEKKSKKDKKKETV